MTCIIIYIIIRYYCCKIIVKIKTIGQIANTTGRWTDHKILTMLFLFQVSKLNQIMEYGSM